MKNSRKISLLVGIATVALVTSAAASSDSAPIPEYEGLNKSATATKTKAGFTQLNQSRIERLARDIQLRDPLSIDVQVGTSGEILVVEFGTDQYRAFSFPATQTGPAISATGWKPILPTQTLAINVTGAVGVYTVSSPGVSPNYKRTMSGNLASNNRAQNYIAQGNLSMGSGMIPDAPVGVLDPASAVYTSLVGGDANPAAAFHRSAVDAGLQLQRSAESAFFSFQNKATAHIVKTYQEAEAIKASAWDLLAKSKYQNGAVGSLVQVKLDALNSAAQSNSALASQQANQLSSVLVDPQVTFASCIQRIGQTNERVQAFTSKYDLNDESIEDEKVDTPNDQPQGEDQFDNDDALMEACIVNVAANLPAFDESNTPITPIDPASYLQSATDFEALRDATIAAADILESKLDADATEAFFRPDLESYLGFQRGMLKMMQAVGDAAAFNEELGALSQGPITAATVNMARDIDANAGTGRRPARLRQELAQAGRSASSAPANLAKAGATSTPACDLNLNPFSLNISVAGASFIMGTPWNDKINGTPGVDIALGLGGNDCIDLKGGIDFAFGMGGDDDISGSDGHDFLFGGKGQDIIKGGTGESYTVTIGTSTFKVYLGNLIDGGAGDDTIYGLEKSLVSALANKQFTDIIFGDGLAKSAEQGADLLDGQSGINFILGQAGDDVIKSEKKGIIEINGVAKDFGTFFFGLGGNDTITGSPAFDGAFGNAGNDTIELGDDIDLGIGGGDNDTIDGGKSFDIIVGGRGNDILHGNEGGLYDFDLVIGGPGDDFLGDRGGLFSLLIGGKDNDVIIASGGINISFGGSGRDLMLGGDSYDLMFGGNDANTVHGRGGIDAVFGDTDRDVLSGGDGAFDLVIAGAGSDYLRGGDGSGNSASDGIDLLFGFAGNDFIQGDGGFDIAFGQDGDDVIEGNDGFDLLFGGIGDDCLNGNDGIDALFGGAGNDRLNAGAGAANLLVAGAGTDHLWGEGASGDLMIGGGDAEFFDAAGGINLVIAGGGDDQISSSGLSVILGNGGSDFVSANGGFNIALGGDGNDHISLAPNGIGLGGVGDDRMQFTGSPGPISLLLGGDGSDNLTNAFLSFGGAGADILTGGSSFSLLFAGPDNDQIRTQASAVAFGNSGNDLIRGVAGNNLIFGGGSDDRLYAFAPSSEPRDLLVGGGGSDQLYGNAKDKRDIMFGGSKTRDPSSEPFTAATAITPNAAASVSKLCPVPSSVSAFMAGPPIGSSRKLDEWMRDYKSEK